MFIATELEKSLTVSEKSVTEPVTFIGLGEMGSAMAGRLADRFAMVLFDLDSAKSAAIKGDRITIASTVVEAVQPGGVLITMLPDDDALFAVTKGENGAARRLGPGGLHINMSTVSPQAARELAELYESEDGSYVSATVWGRPPSAASGELVCSLAGPAKAKERARPYLNVLAMKIQGFGEDPHLANVAKVVGNFLVASAIEALGESLTLAEKHGLDRHVLAELLVSTIFDCRIYRIYGPLVAAQASGPAGFTAELGRKDLELVRQAAAEVDVSVPFQNIIGNRLIATVAKGRGKQDWSALSWLSAEDAGLIRPVAN